MMGINSFIKAVGFHECKLSSIRSVLCTQLAALRYLNLRFHLSNMIKLRHSLFPPKPAFTEENIPDQSGKVCFSSH
jgi:hypothetical protein